jgi:flagellar hook-basal body protein
VGHNPATDGDVDFVQLSDTTYTGSPQMSIGTMAFMGGKNIDTLQLGSDGQPENDANTSFYINALSSDADEGDYGITEDDGIMQFTLSSNDMSALIAPGQTYANNQDGHTVSNLSSYAIDSEGKVIATYDNGETLVKGQIALALFSNPDGLMPNGSNTFTATPESSGEPIFSAPGSGLLGQVRSKALESSNVDLTSQLVQLMVLQRQYSATSQALKLQASTLIDDAINMGR